MSTYPHFARPWEERLVQARMLVDVTRIALRSYPTLREAQLGVRALLRRVRWFEERLGKRKYVRVGDHWHTRLVFPRWPSPAFTRWVEEQLNELVPYKAPTGYVPVVIWAVTRLCSLHCQHCSAADELGPEDTVDLATQKAFLARLQERGVHHVELTGGEPLRRFDDVVELLRSSSPDTDFWMATSGYGLTPERARALSDAGLVGVKVSLDHWQPEEHDRFRGLPGTFAWVRRAARAAHDNGLVFAVSLCPTRDFVSPENLAAYAQLAGELGAAFIRVVEPKDAGRYSGRDVGLTDEHTAMLDAWELAMNTDPAYRDLPAVSNLDAVWRRVGCMSAGDLGMYVDNDGKARSCPFCDGTAVDVLHGSLDEGVSALRNKGCSRVPAARVFATPSGLGRT